MTRVSTLMAPVATGAILAVAACSISEAGTPRATTPVPVASMDPCTLLTDSDRALFGVKNGEPVKLGDVKGCDWLRSGEFALSVALHPNRGFANANLQGSAATSVSIGRHQAHQVQNMGGGKGSCDIYLEVDASSIAQAQGLITARNDTPKACALATQVAQIIDPKLP